MQSKIDKKENIAYQQLFSRHKIILANNQWNISNKQLKSSNHLNFIQFVTLVRLIEPHTYLI